MLKISEDDGTSRVVLLNKDLPLADGIVVQGDEIVLVNSMKKLWVLQSQDSWGGVVYHKTDLEEERVLTS
ncbi:hypothetical protein PanWU01x14_262570 [Parasponia andersonii]|uniref:Uncharacterized protein n=1 Tax=Parasponia andersonii TaxID=3476 RepID=A0A2P5B852_PARAD|nr:hypothetical protein PanWU01x14_262570 [Parasponia andersonii]